MRPRRDSSAPRRNPGNSVSSSRRRHTRYIGDWSSDVCSSDLSFGQAPGPVQRASDGPLKIDAVELIELHGRYTEQVGVDGQSQVNPLDIYDDLRPQPYKDQPSGTREVQASAVYLRIRTAAGLDGLYGPIEKSAGIVVHTDRKSTR